MNKDHRLKIRYTVLISLVPVTIVALWIWYLSGFDYIGKINLFIPFIGSVIGGITTLIALVVSTNETRKIQNESKDFETKKIKINLQIEIAQQHLLLVGENKINYSYLNSFLLEKYNQSCISLDESLNKYIEIDNDEFEVKYNELKESIKKIKYHLHSNKIVLIRLYDHYRELDKLYSKMNNLKESIIEINVNGIANITEHYRIYRLLYSLLEVLEKVFIWLNHLQKILLINYMQDILSENDMIYINDELDKTYYE